MELRDGLRFFAIIVGCIFVDAIGSEIFNLTRFTYGEILTLASLGTLLCAVREVRL